jgi:hypothetical protein
MTTPPRFAAMFARSSWGVRCAACGALALAAFAAGSQATPAATPPAAVVEPWGLDLCRVDLRLPGTMKDILSNVLNQSAKRDSSQVVAFLEEAVKQAKTGDDLLRATAERFEIDEARLRAEVEAMKHVNCTHGPGQTNGEEEESDGPIEPVALSPFARDVAMHVVLHELGHALVREFDLPILGNEETMADAFATHYLTNHMPERAFDVLMARTRSLMIEANDVPREEWPVSGEHDNDARRAYQIVALAIAADPERYAPLAAVVAMSERDQKRAADYGAEIHRSWRRTLQPLLMPTGKASNEARVVVSGDTVFATDDATAAIVAELQAELSAALKRFDWHSSVKIDFVRGDGGASWSRSKRTITVQNAYLHRFVQQGERAAATTAAADPSN